MRQDGEAVARRPQGVVPVVGPLDDVLVDVAGHRRRAAGAALVDEQNVPILPDPLEGRRPGGVELDRRASRAARDRHESVRSRLEGQCRHNGDFEFDRFGIGIGRIERPGEMSAAGGDAGRAGAGVDATVAEFDRGVREGGGRYEEQ